MDVILQQEFRDFVRLQMDEQGLSQGALARKMGISRPVVSQYLNGDRSPGMDVIEKFYAALGFTPRIEPVPKKSTKLGRAS